MNQELLNFIEALSKNDKKTLAQKALKTTEEVGELAKAVLPFENAAGTRHRFVTRQQILENAVDTILCSLSIAYDLGFTSKEIEEMMVDKSNKWSGLQAKESKAKYPLPFEIHVTIEKPNEDFYFTQWCEKSNVKPIILDLQKNDEIVMVDYMTSSKHYGNNNSAIEEAKRLAKSLSEACFKVLRVKIETIPWHPAAPTANDYRVVMTEDSYFESHLRIVTSQIRAAQLRRIAKENDAHLSRNFFKKINHEEYIIMMTLRNYNCTYEDFLTQVEKLKKVLVDSQFVVDKTEVEFAIYDTNTQHDLKWMK